MGEITQLFKPHTELPENPGFNVTQTQTWIWSNLWPILVQIELTLCKQTYEHEFKTISYGNAEELEADVSSSHAVSQFVLVPEERHQAHVSLDLNGLIQDQDTIGLPGNWLHGVDFLRRILELLTKVLDLCTREIYQKTVISCLRLTDFPP